MSKPRSLAAVRPGLARMALLALAAFLGPVVFLAQVLRTAGMPDFATACAEGRPFYVAAVYRGQTDVNRPPSMKAPSVLLFQDTPDNRPHHSLATFEQVGAVWGLAYSRREQAVFAATFHKRGLPYGPAGSGGIYRIDLRTGAISTFATVPDTGGRTLNPRMGNGALDNDQYQARFVGKVALGDLDLNADETELFVVNLKDRRIYRYETATGRLLGSFEHGAVGEPWSRDARPFALEWQDGALYHGLVNERAVSPFEARVYRSAPDGSAMVQVAGLDLRYARDPVDLQLDQRSFRLDVGWRAWSEPQPRETARGQPWLTDLVFTAPQRFALALRDRYWDVSFGWINDRSLGNCALPCPQLDIVLAREQLGFGDLLVAEQREDRHFVVDTRPEPLADTNAIGHEESAMGGLACGAQGSGLVAGIYGVEKTRSETVLGHEGLYWFDVHTGNATSQEVLALPGTFGSYVEFLAGPQRGAAADSENVQYLANVASLGDIEVLCRACGVEPSPTPSATATASPTPTPTPTSTPTGTLPPTVTPSATASPSPSATSSPRPKALYLPLLLREDCDPARTLADVVLLLDISSSMTGEKFAAVKEAARAFVRAMQFPDDRVGLATFAAEGRVLAALSDDEAALLRAIDGMELESGTRIDQGLLRAAELLADRRPATTPMLVLMTDGLQAPEALDRPQELAADLRAGGVLLHAVGLGLDVDADYLLRLAGGDPARLHLSPRSEELVDIYLRIARQIPCPPSAFWKGR